MLASQLLGLCSTSQPAHLKLMLMKDGHTGGLICAEIAICNFGRGPAYALKGEVSLPYENEREKTRISTALEKELPFSLLPGERCNCKVELHCSMTPTNESRKAFLDIKLDYQDSEGNYYVLTQEYDLRVFSHDKSVSRHWQQRRERLEFASLSEQTAWLGVGRVSLVWERTVPRYRDWAR